MLRQVKPVHIAGTQPKTQAASTPPKVPYLFRSKLVGGAFSRSALSSSRFDVTLCSMWVIFIACEKLFDYISFSYNTFYDTPSSMDGHSQLDDLQFYFSLPLFAYFFAVTTFFLLVLLPFSPNGDRTISAFVKQTLLEYKINSQSD